MGYRTRKLLTAATLTLLALACAGGLGASKAAVAVTHATTTVHKISACGYTATAAGTYELAKNITDAGSGNCIILNGNNITLYLDGHTITGTGSDTCIYVEGGGTSLSVNETVIGGTMVNPEKRAKLSNCKYGLYVSWTSGTTASYLTIVAPVSYGVYSDQAGGMTLDHLNVPLHAKSAYGVYLSYGADNVVTRCVVNNNGSDSGFFASHEVGDTFTWDTVKDTYSNAGSAGTGFYDESSTHDVYAHDTSQGQYNGFYFSEAGSGTVTAAYDTAVGPSANPTSYGFYVYGAYQKSDSASRFHTTIQHNTADGFQYGFFDESDSSYAAAERWIGNTADNYAEYGFYVFYPTDYTMTGNIADANTAGMTYAGGISYGFYLLNPSSYYPFASFDDNQAYDSEYGFYSDESMVGGKGNVAKRNHYQSYDVEIAG